MADVERFTKLETFSLCIGTALLQIQMTEHIIRQCTTYFLPKTFDIAAIFAEREKERKKAMGYFIKKLRERVDVDPEFDAHLSSFLENRNKFAHTILQVPGIGMEDDVGLENGIRFTIELQRQARYIGRIIMGLSRIAGKKIGIDASSERLEKGFKNPDFVDMALANIYFKFKD